MGRLDQEPFDQRVINERMKATRGMDGDLMDDGSPKKKKHNEKVNYSRMGELAVSKRAERVVFGSKEEYRQQLNARKPYTAKEMTWRAPNHFRVFDPSEYAAERKVKLEMARIANWQPDSWDQVPTSCHKPTRDLGQCD